MRTQRGDCPCGAEDVYLWKGRCSPCTGAQVMAGQKPDGSKLPLPGQKVRPKRKLVDMTRLGTCAGCNKPKLRLYPDLCARCSCGLVAVPKDAYFPVHVKRGPKRSGPGRPKGTRAPVVPWTEDEWTLVRHALLYGRKGTRARDLLPHMPGRTQPNLHYAFNIERRRQALTCACGTPVTKPGTNCDACKAKMRNRLDRLKAEGRCACGNDLNEPGSSGTRCKTCRQKRSKYNKGFLKKFRQKNAKISKPPIGERSHRVLPWPGCGHIKWAAKIAAKTQRPVISLFGGSGEDLRLVHYFDGTPVGYYDLDEDLTCLIRCAKNGSQFEVRDEARRMAKIYDRTSLTEFQTTSPIQQAAKIATLARSRIKNRLIAPSKEFTPRMKMLGEALAHASVECRDALHILHNPDVYLPHNAVLLIDPPWPGARHPYNHTLDNYEDLLNLLVELPDGMDYILSLGSERDALINVAKTMPHAPLYWRTGGPQFAKSIVSLSPRLARNTPEPGKPIVLNALGISTP